MNTYQSYFSSSIGKKQVVATTGLLLILYIIMHLAGNLLMLGGPELFNWYAAKLRSLGPILKVIELALLSVFVIHIYFTYLVVWENIRARGHSRYSVDQPVGERSLATRLMPYTGTFLFLFLVWHLLDFTYIDHEGPRCLINGINFGLYGIVYNSFVQPLHSGLYIMAMGCLGFHLAHGLQSFFQTYGLNSKRSKMLGYVSGFFGLLVAFGFSLIPIFVLLHNARYHF